MSGRLALLHICFEILVFVGILVVVLFAVTLLACVVSCLLGRVSGSLCVGGVAQRKVLPVE